MPNAPTPPPLLHPPPPGRNWWKRNWPWLIPAGCLSLLLLLALLIGLIVLIGKFVWDLHLDQWL